MERFEEGLRCESLCPATLVPRYPYTDAASMPITLHHQWKIRCHLTQRDVHRSSRSILGGATHAQAPGYAQQRAPRSTPDPTQLRPAASSRQRSAAHKLGRGAPSGVPSAASSRHAGSPTSRTGPGAPAAQEASLRAMSPRPLSQARNRRLPEAVRRLLSNRCIFTCVMESLLRACLHFGLMGLPCARAPRAY